MGVAMCKDIGLPCCGSAEDPGHEVRTEIPSYSVSANGYGLPNNAPPSYSGVVPNPFAQPMSDDYGQVQYAPPPPGGGSSPPMAGGGGGAGLTVDTILSDLDAAEMKAYQDAFVNFAGGSPVGLDNDQMRGFLMNNGTFDDIDMDMMKVMNGETMEIDLGAFLELLRTHSVSDGDAIGQFTMLSQDPDSPLAAEECRTGLTMMGMQKFGVNYEEDRWDSILNMVMMDAGPTVALEQWMVYCKQVARYIRLFNYCGL
jgi:hypothetical protein